MKKYEIYKGLQRPLVFKMFKGKFIFQALGSVGAGVIVGGVITALVSSVIGLVSMLLITLFLLLGVLQKQKKGLSNKKREEAIYIHRPTFNRKSLLR